MAYSDYESVIGLEIHAQLLTKTKMFCGCPTTFSTGDNENTCPVCTGMPGALPVLNKKAVELSIRMGLALGCEIKSNSVFARKNYFYPDLPKGYQISQYDLPLCEGGVLEFSLNGEKKKVGITRAHMEEDAGKSTHFGDFTLVNLNRSSVPLLEIVSEPDMRSPEEAAEYARTMRSILTFAGVCDGNLEEGSMRCDCNVSIRKKGAKEFGTRVELKNINSFRFVEKAIQFEIERQIDCVESGEKIVQETRLYDPDKNKTFSMRSKEEAHDYRYFPEPDLIPVAFSESWVQEIKKNLPELPIARARRFQSEYALPEYDANVLTQTKDLADYFEDVAKRSKNPKSSSNWVMVELLAKLNEAKLEIFQSPIPRECLADLIVLIDKGIISGRIAKTLFADMFVDANLISEIKQAGLEEIVKKKGLIQITDTSKIEKAIQDVIDANPGQTADYRAGKVKLFGFFVGQVMKVTAGQASPEVVNKILTEKLKG